MQRVQELEKVVDEIFDQVCPLHHGQVRAIKPTLAPALGCLIPDKNRRCLQDRRTYYRLDFTDFLDYSTSGLPAAPLLSRFPEGEAQFYQALETAPSEPLMTFPPFEKGVAVLDAALARSDKVFVSATMRFKIFGLPDGSTMVATLTFAPMPMYKGDPSFDPETSALQEWDRYIMSPPVEADPQWRFTMSGIYTDDLLDDMERRPNHPGALPAQQIAQARKSREANQTTYAGIFELTRLALFLPSYFDFMYDLIVDEVVSAPRDESPRARGTTAPVVHPQDTPIYRVVKSIRVIREAPGLVRCTRSWTPPQYCFAVKGHWRHYDEPSMKGHDPTGNVIFGKTWVRDYTKGKGKPPWPGDTETFRADPSVVINIKQTLAHARDIIAAQTAAPQPATSQPAYATKQSPAVAKPTVEWMATERAKLTSSLRFLIMRRDSFRCRLCGKSASSDNGVRLEVDHIKPVSSWGTTAEENLWTLCRECNHGKHDGSLVD